MSMLKKTLLSQVFIANKLLTSNSIGSIESGNKLIKKSEKLFVK